MQKNTLRHSRQLLVALLAGSAIGGTAHAQSAPPSPAGANTDPVVNDGTTLADIIVTAERREQSAQTAPVSIAVIDGGEITRRGVTDLASLSRIVPALQASPAAGPYPIFSMRGIYSASVNQFSDAAIATAIDGVFLARPFASHGMFYDIERVEVLKAPRARSTAAMQPAARST